MVSKFENERLELFASLGIDQQAGKSIRFQDLSAEGGIGAPAEYVGDLPLKSAVIANRTEFPEAWLLRATDSQATQASWLYAPHGLPLVQNRVSVLSSRWGRDPQKYQGFVQLLRSYTLRLAGKGFGSPQREVGSALVTAVGTTPYRFVRRLAELVDLPLIEIRPWDADAGRAGTSKKTSPVVSPAIFPVYRIDEGAADRPLDQWVMRLSDELRVLYLRPGGTVARLVQHQLQQNAVVRAHSTGNAPVERDQSRQLPVRNVYLGLPASVSRSDQQLANDARRWLGKGCVGWTQVDENKAAHTHTNGQSWRRGGNQVIRLEQLGRQAEEFLQHFTRPRRGPHPDQPENGFIDEILFAKESAFDAVHVLRRILLTQRLIGTNRFTRSHRVCCFTEVPLAEFESRRTFRAHVGRWDFLPYGISVRRSVLQGLGARPVIYGEQADWHRLAPRDQVLFQPARSSSTTVDWSLEKEWRFVGDLCLSRIAREDMFIFVPLDQVEAIADAAMGLRIVACA